MATLFVSSLGTFLMCVYLRGLVYGEEEVHGSFEDMRDILKRVKALEASVSSLKSSFGGLQRPVAFSAYYSDNAASLTKRIKEGSTFVFDKTATNKDGVYSTKTGKFKAPTSGTYAFTWTLCADSRIDDGGYGEFGSELVVGSTVYGKLQVDTEVKYDDDCSTSFVIVHVKAGQNVYLRNIYAHQGRLLSKEGETRTTFSGWMIYSDGTGPAAFSAYYSENAASSTKDIKARSTFIFDRTVLNKGGAYSTATGKFTAPSSGLYAFTWTLCADARINDGHLGEFGSELVVGSSVYGKLHVDTEITNDDDCSTAFVIVHVRAGQEVYLRNIYEHQGIILSKESETRTTFSGWHFNDKTGSSAFSSYFSERAASLTNSIRQGSTFVFDKTVLNKGSAYNGKTGKFKAPSSGTYAFTWTLCADSRINDGGLGEFGSELVVGSSVYGKLHVDAEIKNDDDCSTAFVIVPVKAGQKVYLRNIYTHQGRLLSKEDETRTTFSGWRLSGGKSGPPAFSMYSNRADLTKNIKQGSTFLFDQSAFNQNGAFNKATGKYKAPFTGTYAFTWTFCADSRINDGGWGEFGSELVVGSSVKGKLHVDTETQDDDSCSTGFVIVHVRAGQEVYLRNIYGHQGRLLSKENQTRTTFSGWMLF